MPKRKPFSGIGERSLGFALTELLRLVRGDFMDQARKYKLTPELWRLLYCLARDEGCNQSRLAVVLDVTPVTIGRMLATLEKRGFVRRVPDPDDHRATRIFLTKVAGPVIKSMYGIVDDTRNRAMRGLSPADQDRFWQLFTTIRANLLDTRKTSGARRSERRPVNLK
jgi:DNA-binding MarR family transcriptional regulator